jgi:subtilisin family serine protease
MTGPSRSLLLAAVGLALAGGPGRPVDAGSRADAPRLADRTVSAPAPVSAWLVELHEPGAAVAWAEVVEESGPARRLTHGAIARARAAAEARLRSIGAAQDALAPALARAGAREIYRIRRALDGIAVLATPRQAAALRRLEGVKAVRPIEPAVLHNRTSVPFVGAPALWGSTTPVAAGITGRGVRIGVVDTGIDYVHGDFGGTGLLADYQQAAADSAGWTTSPTSGPGRFPTAKVAGGWDFAGDAYDGGNVPAPDPNPMDCNGHGTHVAGTAAGFGVTAAGATYSGPYDATAPYSTPPRIGPGVAPEATLYALRIFGCGGSSALVPQALDWAIDPDGDGDFSDHLDVVNMSLGSNYGHPHDVTAEAADNAARAGVIVVASAGNAGDTYFVSGTPAVAGRAISVAGSLDDGKGALLRANAPASLAGDFAAGAAFYGPDLKDGAVTGDVAAANDGTGTVTDGCEPFVGFPAGAIALVHYTTPSACSIKARTLNAQDAGAIATIVSWPVTNPPPLGDNPTIVTPVTIPTVSVTEATAEAIEAALGSGAVNVTLLAAGDSLYSLTSRGPRGGVPIRLKPDLAAPGYAITSARNGRTSGDYVPDSASTMMSGTSMAAPHVAGVMALLKQLHPDWTVEQLKALAMTHALHDVSQYSGGLGLRFGMGRVGAGRVDAARALDDLVAFGLDERGLVSVSFDGEVAGAVQRTRGVMVVNHGNTAATLSLGLVPSVDAPGVSFSIVGPSAITVPAGGSVTFDVAMTADASEMDFSADPTVATSQGFPSPIPRSRLSEAAAFLTFSPAGGDPAPHDGGPRMRLPVYAALRPASATEASGPIQTGGAATGSGSLTLTGSGLCTGTVTAGSCAGTFPADRASLVSALELQGVSPKDPALAGTTDAAADLRYAGVQYDAASGLLVFAVATWESWATPAEASFTIVVDGNDDGADDTILMNPRFTSGGAPTDLFLGATGPYEAGATVTSSGYVNLVAPDAMDTSLWGTNVLMMAASPAELGVTVGQPFRWRVVSCPGWAASCALPPDPSPLDSMGPFRWSTAAQGLDFGGSWAVPDQPGNAIPVAWNTANFGTNGTQGALLVHHHNGEGTRAEPVLVQTDAVAPPPSADLAVAVDLPVSQIRRSATAAMAVTVSNAGPSAASGLAVHVPLPPGLVYVSHSGAGAYDPATGLWTVGTLEAAAAQGLSVTFEGRDAGLYTLVAEVAAATPLDPRPGDDRATATITVAEYGGALPGGFFTVLPCRLVDTRDADGTWGGPALAAQTERVFPIVGLCGVSPAAKAVALNLTVTGATGNGHLRAYAAFAASLPRTSVLNFVAGVTRANNAVVALSPLGGIAVFNAMPAGKTHLVVDVVGYFE